MGWYVATELAIRSKGTLYFTVHQHGRRAIGRWVGLSHDGKFVTGWGCLGKDRQEVLDLMDEMLAGDHS